MRKTYIAALLLIIASFCLSIYGYNHVPSKMVVHWNEKGEENGYMAKEWGLFLLPVIMLLLFLLFIVIPRIDPLGENIEKFRIYYDGFVVIFLLYMFIINLQIILWNVGIRIEFNLTLPLLFGILFFYIGILLGKAERNWFVGIRTPWTLSSDNVWKKTHAIGGKLFKVAGIIAVTGIFAGEYAIILIVAPVILFSIFLVVYSYFEWRREA